MNRFQWTVAAAAVATMASAAPTMTGETSAPSNSIFALGRPASVELKATGLKAGERRALSVGVFDQHDAVVTKVKGEIVADAKGEWSGSFRMPTDRYGFYRVRPEAEGDLRLPKVGSRPAGCLTYAVVVDPASRPELDPDVAYAGLHGDVGRGAEIAPWLGTRKMMGVHVIYTDPKEYAKEFARRQAGGWKATGFIDASPAGPMKRMAAFLDDRGRAWLAKGHKDWWDFLKDDEGRRCYTMILTRLAQAAREQMYWEKRRIYSIFWEPDLSAPSPKFLVEAARIARETIKKADPEGLIALPTLSNIGKLDFHRQLFDLGILQYADLFDIHPYVQYPPEPNGFLDCVKKLKRMLAEYGKADIPMFGSESGTSAVNTVPAELRQMNGMVRVQLMLLGEGFRFNCCFYGEDYGGDHGERQDGDYGIMYNLMLPKFRWGTNRVAPRPVMPALSAFSRILDGSRPTARIDSLGETTLGYAYAGLDGTCTLALWDYGGTPRTVSLPVGVQAVVLADIMGNERKVPTPDGLLKVELGESPVYVIGVSPEQWGKGGTMAAKLAAEAKRRAEAEERARKLEIADVRAVFEGDDPALRFRVRNRTGKEMSVRVETRIRGVPEARQSETRPVGAKSEAVVTVPFSGWRPDPFDLFEAELAVGEPGGFCAEKKVKVNFLAAEYLPGVGKGGDFSGWVRPKRHPIPEAPLHYPELRDRADDFSAAMAYGWNEDYLLVDVQAVDDKFMNEKDGWWIWYGDSVQLGFAKARKVAVSANDYGDEADKGTSEINFALTPKGPQAYRTRTFDLRKFPAGQCGEGCIDLKECPFEVRRKELSDGRVAVRYRMAVPWRYLNLIDVGKGDVVYVASYLNDRDESIGHVCQYGTFELQRMAPENFGALYLK